MSMTTTRAYPLAILATAVWLLTTVSAQANSSDPLNIDWDPAPGPADGPPFSAHASRNHALIPYQILGIGGAWLFCTLTLALFLFTFGQRLRHNAQRGTTALDVEMVKPIGSAKSNAASPESKASITWPSPVSAPNFSYPSPTKPGFGVNGSVDLTVAEMDALRRQQDMERMYAAVYEEEEKNSSTNSVSASPPPGAPRLNIPTRPTGPMPSPLPMLVNANRGFKAPPLSHSRKSSASSLASKRKGSIRGLTISSPLHTPTHSIYSHISDDEPLSPRYEPHPPPLPPVDQAQPTRQAQQSQLQQSQPQPQQQQQQQQQQQPQLQPQQPAPAYTYTTTYPPPSGARSPTYTHGLPSGGLSPTYNHGLPSGGLSPTYNHGLPSGGRSPTYNHGLPSGGRSPTYNYGLPSGGRSPTYNYGLPSGGRSPTYTHGLPSAGLSPSYLPPSPRPVRDGISIDQQLHQGGLGSGPSLGSLPLRSPTGLSQTSHSTKVTVLERNHRAGLLSPNTPRTGALPPTPWTGYVPETPITPITPRLVTRRERKQREREGGREVVRETVKEEDEVWN
ncbi:MAG: hypothetical protein M1824_006255 [Vezdaea acicularis]|nr:MAG: hypothetical protein M1824_006255 [Vezdaea acicularis]